MTIVYDFLATSHRLRAGPNAKTKDDRTDKLIYKLFRIKVGATFKCTVQWIFFSKLFYKQSTFVLKEQMFVGDALHSFSQHSPRYADMGCGGWEGNFLITASSKDKTFGQ